MKSAQAFHALVGFFGSMKMNTLIINDFDPREAPVFKVVKILSNLFIYEMFHENKCVQIKGYTNNTCNFGLSGRFEDKLICSRYVPVITKYR